MKAIFFILIFNFFLLFHENINCNLIDISNDFQKIKRIKKTGEPLGCFYNYTAQTGYFTMPSARSKNVGEVAFCYSRVDPYSIYSASMQYFNRLEISFNYWIFNKMLERGFGSLGFGDDADRAANVKLILNKSPSGFDFMPEIAIGLNDFMGSKRFHSKYIVFTKSLNYNSELTVDYEKDRINGFFGGFAIFPFKDRETFLRSLCLAIEYDANDYKNHCYEHPQGKKIKYPINLGINYKIFQIFQLSLSSIRGKKIAGSVLANYNLNQDSGLYPKYLDPPICSIGKNVESERSKKENKEFAGNITKAFKDQGLDLCKATIFYDENDNKSLFLNIVNPNYRNQREAKKRVENILIHNSKSDIFSTTVAIGSEGMALQKYIFYKKYLEEFSKKNISVYELNALSISKDIKAQPDINASIDVFEKRKKIINANVAPKINTYFSSTKGKFKYDAGAAVILEGYLFNQIYYNLQTSYITTSSAKKAGDRDVYHPSNIINVRSDIIKYHKANSFHVDNLYFQKNFNLKNGRFLKVSFGYFEIAYGGVAIEWLYYPLHSNLAFGFDFANVYKRHYSNLGFLKKIRKWENTKAVYEKFMGFQYFFDIYFDYKPLNVVLKTSIGQFLAKDRGVKFELFKSFKSGFNVSTWIAFSSKKELIGNRRYFDKGFSIKVPLDFFMNKSNKQKVSFHMAEWLRDVGQKAFAGKGLYEIIHSER